MRNSVLILFCMLIVAACTPDSGDLTPSAPIPTQTATVTPTASASQTPDLSASWTPAPSPTVEEVDSDFGFIWYRVVRDVNVRANVGTEFDILDIVRVPNYVLVYDATLDYGGYRWGWLLDDCNGLLKAAGWSAVESPGGTVWLEPAPTFNAENCK